MDGVGIGRIAVRSGPEVVGIGGLAGPEVVGIGGVAVGSGSEGEQVFHEKMHTCENIIDHPVATDTTTTTTTTTNNNKHNSDITNDKYVVVSPLFSTFDIDDSTTIIDLDHDNRHTPTTYLDTDHDGRQPTANDNNDDACNDDDDDNDDKQASS